MFIFFKKVYIFVQNKQAMKFSDKLNEFDVLDLLNEYHSEMRKLKNKLVYVKKRISELEEEYERILKRKEKRSVRPSFADDGSDFTEEPVSTEAETVEEVEIVTADAIEKKQKPAKETKKKAPDKKKKLSKMGRKQQGLSQWDQMIVDAVKAKGKAAINSEILEAVTKKAIEHGVYEDEKKTRAKINQCLVKLTSDNRKALIKVSYSGRGYGYVLPKWVNKEGELIEAYAY